MRYECHLTFEPVFDEKLEDLKAMCRHFNFRVADLVMVKKRKETPERSNKDTFCTGHGETYEDIWHRMTQLHCRVEYELGIKVWRRKIEEIILDERFNKEEVI